MRDCLRGEEKQAVDGLFFAAATSLFKEKMGSSLIAAVVDLRF